MSQLKLAAGFYKRKGLFHSRMINLKMRRVQGEEGPRLAPWVAGALSTLGVVAPSGVAPGALLRLFAARGGVVSAHLGGIGLPLLRLVAVLPLVEIPPELSCSSVARWIELAIGSLRHGAHRLSLDGGWCTARSGTRLKQVALVQK